MRVLLIMLVSLHPRQIDMRSNDEFVCAKALLFLQELWHLLCLSARPKQSGIPLLQPSVFHNSKTRLTMKSLELELGLLPKQKETQRSQISKSDSDYSRTMSSPSKNQSLAPSAYTLELLWTDQA